MSVKWIIFWNISDELDQSKVSESGEGFVQDQSTTKLQNTDTLEPEISTSSTSKLQKVSDCETKSPKIVSFFSKKTSETTADNDKHISEVRS